MTVAARRRIAAAVLCCAMVGSSPLPDFDAVAREGRHGRALERVGAEGGVRRAAAPWRMEVGGEGGRDWECGVRGGREASSTGVGTEASEAGVAGLWRWRWVFLT